MTAMSTRFDEAPIGNSREDAGVRVRCRTCDDYQDFYGGHEETVDALQTWQFHHGMDVCSICNECNRLAHDECKDVDPFAAFYGAVAS